MKYKNNLMKCLIALLVVAVLSIFNVKDIKASTPTDEIVNYTIFVNVLDDASLDITYKLSWKVLESKSAGPLEWVKIGIPNKHCKSYSALSNNISKISTMNSSGNYIRVDFDRPYYEGEVVDFSYKIIQDNVYLYNNETNTATYFFTPGWFDDIAVDNLTIMWNSDKVETYVPATYNDNGYLFFNTSLRPGGKYEVKVTYNADAYKFNTELLTVESPAKSDSAFDLIFFDVIPTIIGIIFALAFMFMPLIIPFIIGYSIYKSATGFTMASDRKVTRTLVEYYPSCPNCGGTRKEGTEKCAYCESNMVKSKTIVDETKLKQLKENDGDILSYNKTGEYKYKGSPNTFMRVNVVHMPHVSHSSGRGSSSGHHSSCAHSSCACACACACAGGGRAGCSTKDFYNTNLKLKYLKITNK